MLKICYVYSRLHTAASATELLTGHRSRMPIPQRILLTRRMLLFTGADGNKAGQASAARLTTRPETSPGKTSGPSCPHCKDADPRDTTPYAAHLPLLMSRLKHAIRAAQVEVTSGGYRRQ
jgi:hypothetical protein